MRLAFALALGLGSLVTPCLVGCSAPSLDAPRPQIAVAMSADAADALRDELLALEADDQRYEHLVINGDPAIREPGFFDRKAALQIERADRCREIFEAVGFPGYDTVGKEASHAFWLLVQHADHDPAFQEAVVVAMAEAHERRQASGRQLAYLTDRVRVNTGRPQRYGTQVEHDVATGRVFPKPLEQPARVDELRAEAGLEPLWASMNGHAQLFYQMNEALMNGRGVTEPFAYDEGFSDW